jgi:formylglycine-generating enzyme required for sulfatase activity
MSGEEKTVFISYRRSASKHLAGRIFDHLRSHDYDVFLDVTTIDAGEIDRIILKQIAARAHFIVLLSRGSLIRCADEGDWLRREIEEAFRLNRNIIPVFDEGFNLDEEKQHLPEPLRTDLSRRNGLPLPYYYFDAGMETLRTRFLKQPIYNIVLTPVPAKEQAEVERRIARASASPSDITNILPQPFEWCPIPKDFVTLEDASREGGTTGGKYEVPAFAIAKYAITIFQYQAFLYKIDGRRDAHWWDYSPDAMKWHADRPTLTDTFDSDDLPRTNICWYDAVAFCRWLSDKTGQAITLPTEQQWQRAAQGNDNRVFPWGNEKPDKTRCNFSRNVGQTTPVTQYPHGASPYNVMNMSGNVWEWCLTEWGTERINMIGNNPRVVRGGSWRNYNVDFLRAADRFRVAPNLESRLLGFRIVCS